ncbi:MAG: long-chain-fatty-acid--CoA ligase [Desulfobacteraceae bacterium]|nr:MAG: long-chain-fatty-acid--CoA ligase [Desulfobacteraceae bacterium]
MVVGDMLKRNAIAFPGHQAIVTRERSLSYKTLNDRVNGLAQGLLKKGLKKGDRVGVLVHNRHQFVETYFAAAKTGAVFCPYNTHLTPAELKEMVNYSAPRILIFDDDFPETIDDLRRELESVECFIALGKPGLSYVEEYESFLDSNEKGEPSVAVCDDDIMSIFFTSGTTGKPKGAMRTHRHVLANIVTGLIEFGIGYGERVMVVFPMYHISYEDNIGRSFYLPNTMIIRREGGFDPDEVLGLLSRERITFCHLVPTMINGFLRSPNVATYDLKSLKTIFYAGAPMPVDLLKKAMAVFRARFFQGYGLTESGPQTTLLRPQDHVVEGTERQLRRLGSVGTPVVGFEVRIVRKDGTPAAIGEVGEITGRSEAIMKGYWLRPEETAERLREGWLHTGDLGKIDDDGYIYLVDRKHDMIISGGINIYPREVEEVLYRHPAVFEASVFGVPHDYWGEAVKAVIVLKNGASASEDAIIRFCGEHLTSYKKPKSVEFWEELPKNATGKIMKRSIRDRYRQTGRKTG